ncbi:MAG: hypothetical protein WC714_28905 [Candidatus Obscuribacterales bacterium]|jgi:hypothetical protein
MTNILYHIGKALAHAWVLGTHERWTQDYGWASGIDIGQDAVVRVTVEVVEKAPYVLADDKISADILVDMRLEEVTA